MTGKFHRILNRMALFTALIIAGLIMFYIPFLNIAATNIWLNGIIIGTAIFGAGLCFVDIFRLVPEYRWMRRYFSAEKNAPLPPGTLRPVAMILTGGTTGTKMSPISLNSILDMILGRFEDSRENIRYITNTLIFLGLLGTFWGLIQTVGGFAELVNGLNFNDENIMTALQSGLTKPLVGMGIAFTSSLFGLAGSLIVGFLGLHVQMAQNTIFRELEEKLATRTKLFDGDIIMDDTSDINTATSQLAIAVKKLEKTVAKLT